MSPSSSAASSSSACTSAPESGEPRRKRRLQPSRQRQRFRRPDRIEIGRCRRELDQRKRIASRLDENPLLQLVGQGGPVHFEKRARRGVVQPGKDKLREAGLVETTWHPT